jgi:hypothetical protein
MEPHLSTNNAPNYADETREALVGEEANINGSDFRIKVFETESTGAKWNELGVGTGKLIIVVYIKIEY